MKRPGGYFIINNPGGFVVPSVFGLVSWPAKWLLDLSSGELNTCWVSPRSAAGLLLIFLRFGFSFFSGAQVFPHDSPREEGGEKNPSFPATQQMFLI